LHEEADLRSHLLLRTLRLKHAFVTLSLVAALPACTRQDADSVTRTEHPTDLNAVPGGQVSPIASGEVVAALDSHMWIVFQASGGAYWFGSEGQGIYRFDGKTIVRFTTQHGLGGDHIRGIQQDRSGNIYACSDPGGVSRFDGRTFTTLPVADPSKNVWRLDPDDLWFPGGQDSGAVYRYDGKSLHRLTFPKTRAGEAHIAKTPRSQFPNAKYSPYDVYTIFKDSKGHVWFGTANLGVCRYDGTSHAWAAQSEVDQTEINAAANFGIRSIIVDKDGKFWFTNTLNRYGVLPATPAEQAAGELRLRKQPGVGVGKEGHSVFMSAVKDKKGDLWLATLGAGVWRYDGTNMTYYPVMHGDTSIWTYSIYEDRQGVLWLGTQEHGVYRFNGTAFEKFKF
jgi:ligand-binding sensor domain-containing protein